MSKLAKLIWGIFGLLIIAAIALPMVAYQVELPRQREIQTNSLKRAFTKVSLQNGKVLFVPHRRAAFIRTIDRRPFNKPMLFSVNSQFRAMDNHFGVTYTITSIEPDGVVIHFDASGSPPSTIRRSSGTVKVPWK